MSVEQKFVFLLSHSQPAVNYSVAAFIAHRRRKRGGQGGRGPLTFFISPSTKCGKNYAHAQQYSSRKVTNFSCGRSAVVLGSAAVFVGHSAG